MTHKGVTRRQSRETAFQFLYGYLPSTSEAPLLFSQIEFEKFCVNFNLPHDEFSWELAFGTGKEIQALDLKITSLSTNWRLERMPRVDRTILRLSAYEILFRTDIPKTVAINEAVELAKRFGEIDSPGFVNGILDKL